MGLTMNNSNNMGVSLDTMSCTYHHWHPPTYVFSSGKFASSSSCISCDQCSNSPTIPLLQHCSNFSEKSGNCDFESQASFARSGYPSPPSTTSGSKRSVPLPCLHADHVFTPERCPSSKPFGGLLDSPLVMRHDSLGCHAPISPPPTLPTETQTLPPLDDNILASIPESDDLDSSHFLHKPLSRDDAQPTSPVSPEWATNGIPSEIPQSPERSFLLHQSRSNLFDHATDDLGIVGSWTRQPLSPPPQFLDKSPPSPYPWSCDMFVDSVPESPLPSPPASPVPKTLDLDHLDCVQLPSSPSVPSPSLELEGDGMHEIVEEQNANTPYFDTQDNLTDYSLSPPSSPGQTVLALPGADPTDDFFILKTSEVDLYSYSPHTSSRSLLLLDDPNDVPPPRSPSPETFQLDLSQLALEGCADPEVRRLWDLRKASQVAERNARILEEQALEEGRSGVSARWEARQTKKREKERGREVAAMLRLKLAEKGVKVDDGGPMVGAGGGLAGAPYGDGSDGNQDMMQIDREERDCVRPTKLKTKRKKNTIGSMDQLVARMLLRRNVTSRSIVNRKTPLQFHPKSPLSRRVISVYDTDADIGEDDEDDWDLDLRSWPME